MVEKKRAWFILSERAFKAVADEIENSQLRDPVPSLLWGRWNDESKERLVLGFFERENVQIGWLMEANGLEFYTHQDQVLWMLQGRTLDYENGKLFIKDIQ